MQKSNTIPQLLKTIEDFQIVKCNMYHESVVIDSNRKPVYKRIDDAIVFDRVSLCDANHRKVRLGCAHSIVNSNFSKILENAQLLIPKQSNEILIFKNKFEAVIAKIYVLDHKKGQMEHELAIFEMTSNGKSNAQLDLSMNVLKAEHNILMDNIISIKSDIESFISKVINNSNL